MATIDLKNLLPLMIDTSLRTWWRLTSVNPRFQHCPCARHFFKDLAHAVVHTILAPLNSQHTVQIYRHGFSQASSGIPFQLCRTWTDPALAAIGLWMAYREIRSASGILSLLTPSSLHPPLDFCPTPQSSTPLGILTVLKTPFSSA